MRSSITGFSRIRGGTLSQINGNSIYIKVLLGLMALLQVVDGVMTDQVIGRGLMQESNVLIKSLINAGIFPIAKIVGAIFCCVVLWFLYKRFRVLALATITTVIVFYGVVVIWNLSMITHAFIR